MTAPDHTLRNFGKLGKFLKFLDVDLPFSRSQVGLNFLTVARGLGIFLMVAKHTCFLAVSPRFLKVAPISEGRQTSRFSKDVMLHQAFV